LCCWSDTQDAPLYRAVRQRAPSATIGYSQYYRAPVATGGGVVGVLDGAALVGSAVGAHVTHGVAVACSNERRRTAYAQSTPSSRRCMRAAHAGRRECAPHSAHVQHAPRVHSMQRATHRAVQHATHCVHYATHSMQRATRSMQHARSMQRATNRAVPHRAGAARPRAARCAPLAPRPHGAALRAAARGRLRTSVH
jgi:hypothetical protein